IHGYVEKMSHLLEIVCKRLEPVGHPFTEYVPGMFSSVFTSSSHSFWVTPHRGPTLQAPFFTPGQVARLYIPSDYQKITSDFSKFSSSKSTEVTPAYLGDRVRSRRATSWRDVALKQGSVVELFRSFQVLSQLPRVPSMEKVRDDEAKEFAAGITLAIGHQIENMLGY
ncbi:hypothetical protein V1478_008780, partial [Vespula squamosa]